MATNIKPGSTRWWKTNPNGTYTGRLFGPGEQPDTTIWRRGISPTHAQSVVDTHMINSVLLGVPKTQEHKEKMSKAKLGVPKSEQHKLNMSRSHYERSEQVHELMKQTGMDYYAACKAVSTRSRELKQQQREQRKQEALQRKGVKNASE